MRLPGPASLEEPQGMFCRDQAIGFAMDEQSGAGDIGDNPGQRFDESIDREKQKLSNAV